MQRRLNALGIIIAVTAAPAMAQTKQQMERFARESSLIGTAGFAISSTGASPGGGKVAEVPVLSAMMGFSHKDNGLGVSFGTLVPLEDGEGDALLPDVDKQEALINSLSFRWEVPYLPDMVTHTFSYSHTYFPQGNTIGIDVMKSWGMRTRLNVLLNPSVGFSYNLNKPFRGHVNASAGLSESVYQSGLDFFEHFLFANSHFNQTPFAGNSAAFDKQDKRPVWVLQMKR